MPNKKYAFGLLIAAIILSGTQTALTVEDPDFNTSTPTVLTADNTSDVQINFDYGLCSNLGSLTSPDPNCSLSDNNLSPDTETGGGSGSGTATTTTTTPAETTTTTTPAETTPATTPETTPVTTTEPVTTPATTPETTPVTTTEPATTPSTTTPSTTETAIPEGQVLGVSTNEQKEINDLRTLVNQVLLNQQAPGQSALPASQPAEMQLTLVLLLLAILCFNAVRTEMLIHRLRERGETVQSLKKTKNKK